MSFDWSKVRDLETGIWKTYNDGGENVDFYDVLMYSVSQLDFVKEWNRLRGNHLGDARSALVQMIDEATGYDQNLAAMPQFIEDVYNIVWLPLINKSMA